MPTARLDDLMFLFNDLECVSESESDRITSLDPNDTKAVEDVIVTYIRPWFHHQPSEIQRQVKDSLRYYLNRQDEELLQEVLHRIQESPLRAPESACWLYGLIWDVLFPGDNVALPGLEDWHEVR